MSVRIDTGGSAEVEDGGMQEIRSTREARPASSYHTDRPSARTAEEREAHFEHWWTKYGQPYEAAVVEAEAEPWTDSLHERRELFMRRYHRPAPPAGLYRDPRPARSENYTIEYPERNAA